MPSLVGSEMCIRDRARTTQGYAAHERGQGAPVGAPSAGDHRTAAPVAQQKLAVPPTPQQDPAAAPVTTASKTIASQEEVIAQLRAQLVAAGPRTLARRWRQPRARDPWPPRRRWRRRRGHRPRLRGWSQTRQHLFYRGTYSLRRGPALIAIESTRG